MKNRIDQAQAAVNTWQADMQKNLALAHLPQDASIGAIEGALELFERMDQQLQKIRDILERLSGDSNSEVREAVALNPNTPIAILEKLSMDISFVVRAAVAVNSHTPLTTLERLAMDKEEPWPELKRGPYVKCRVFNRDDLPVSMLEKFAGDNDSVTRGCVAGSPSTPEMLLERLARDKSKTVRKEVILAITWRQEISAQLLEKFARNPDPSIRQTVAKITDAVALLKKLGNDGELNVRMEVMSNRKTPAGLKISILERLAMNKNASWRICAARNFQTPIPSLEKLEQDDNAKVSAAARMTLRRHRL